MEILEAQLEVAKDAMKKGGLTAENIAAIGITNQRETTVIWERATGKPIHHAIVWHDKRTSDMCDALKQRGFSDVVKAKSGLVIDAYFSATKMKWILNKVPGAMDRAKKGELCAGTIDCWLVWNLTKGEHHVTDISNASRSMLLNIHTKQWDDELLEIFGLPKEILPTVKSSSEVYGVTTFFDDKTPIPISGIAGDQNAALFGQTCMEYGMSKVTYGTGCFLLMNTGSKPIASNHKLLTTIAWDINGETTYALEGCVFIAGAVVQWLRDGLQIIENSSEIEELSQSVDSSGGVYVVPAFTGLGAPYWNQHAKGTIMGLTRGSTKAHIARASVESIAFQTMDVIHAMEKDMKTETKALRIDGGASCNNMLAQFQSDLLNVNVVRPKNIETTSLGAAYLAGLAVGYWDSIDEIKQIWEVDREFSPSVKMSQEDRKTTIKAWRNAVSVAEYHASISLDD